MVTRKMSAGSVAITLLMIGSAYGAFALFLFFTQSSLLYFPAIPSRDHVASPQTVGLAYDSVTLMTDDGIRLDGWYVPAENARGVVLFLHGNAGNISHRLDSLQIFNRLRLSTLIIDYRGYGRSEGKPSEQGTYRDAEAAWRYLTEERKIPPQKIVLFGRSLGAAVAAWLASREQAAALIAESAFISVPELAAGLYPFLPARLLSRFSYDTQAYLSKITCPLLVVHSRHDEIIPFRHGRQLFEAGREPKQFLELRGGHNDGFLVSGEAYTAGLQRFLDTYL